MLTRPDQTINLQKKVIILPKGNYIKNKLKRDFELWAQLRDWSSNRKIWSKWKSEAFCLIFFKFNWLFSFFELKLCTVGQEEKFKY